MSSSRASHWKKNTAKRDLHYFGRVCHAMCDNKNERAVIVFTVTQHEIKLETVQKKLPEEEAKKMKCCKRLIYKQFSKSQVFMSHSFWLICRNVSRTFVGLCTETPYWCTVLVHQYSRRKSTKTSFSIKALPFHSRTSIRTHKHIF